MAKSKRVQTVADLIAATELGTIDPTTEVVTAAEAAKQSSKAAREAAEAERATAQAQVAAVAGRALSATAHECGIPGCRHGSAHPVVSQPDRQVKLQCPHGAVARMTARALAKAGGSIFCAEGEAFAPVARRTYVRKSAE